MSADRPRAPRVARERTNMDLASAAITSPSVLSIMQLRYEESFRLYNLIDSSQPPKPEDADAPDWLKYYRCQAALRTLNGEQDALQRAILHQLPADDDELAVLVYHLSLVSEWDAEDRNDLCETALDAIVDYLASKRVPAGALADGLLVTQATKIAQGHVGFRKALPEFLA
jgi:hypothetical protein